MRFYEGDNVDDSRDPGGRTSRGVIQRVYDGWCRRNGVARGDVWKATDAQVAATYRELYWDRLQGDGLPAGVDFVLFDCAVNSGVGQAAKWLQRSLHAYTGQVNGDLGAATLKAVENPRRRCADRRGRPGARPREVGLRGSRGRLDRGRRGGLRASA